MIEQLDDEIKKIHEASAALITKKFIKDDLRLPLREILDELLDEKLQNFNKRVLRRLNKYETNIDVLNRAAKSKMNDFEKIYERFTALEKLSNNLKIDFEKIKIDNEEKLLKRLLTKLQKGDLE